MKISKHILLLTVALTSGLLAFADGRPRSPIRRMWGQPPRLSGGPGLSGRCVFGGEPDD